MNFYKLIEKSEYGGTILIIMFSLMVLTGIIVGSYEIYFSHITIKGKKYIYFDRGRNTISSNTDSPPDTIRYEEVISSFTEKKGQQVTKYYKTIYSIFNNSNDSNLFPKEPDASWKIPKFLQVGIVGYNEDSSLVEIKAEFDYCCRSQFVSIVRWVPAFTLHDTLPQKRYK